MIPAAFGVEADAAGEAAGQIGPDALPGQAAVGGDVEGGEPVGVGLGEDERRAVRVTAMPPGKASPPAA